MTATNFVVPSTRPLFDKAEIVNESTLILPDIEVPFHNAVFINKCINLAIAWGIRHCIWAGDFLHLASLSPFPDSEKDLEKEVDEVEELLGGFLKPFKKILWFSGNHDRRAQAVMQRLLGLDKFARIFVPKEFVDEFSEKVTASNYYWCWVGTGKERWRIVHPKATNTVPANAARSIAEAYGCNVAMAHDHLFGMQQTRDGKHWGIEIGCCVDIKRLNYYQLRDTTRPKMVNGALILEKRNNQFFPTLLSPAFTDWERLMGSTKRGQKFK